MNKISQNNVKFRISNLGERMDIPCGQASRLLLNFVAIHGNTWSTAVIAIRRSLDNDNIVEFPTTISVSGETMLEVDVSACNFVHLVVTTAQSTTSDVYVNWMTNDYQSV